MEDTYRHKGLRKKLVEEIRSKGIHDELILQAISKVPRHFFMDSSFINFSYKDKAFPIRARTNNFTTLYSCISDNAFASETQ